MDNEAFIVLLDGHKHFPQPRSSKQEEALSLTRKKSYNERKRYWSVSMKESQESSRTEDKLKIPES